LPFDTIYAEGRAATSIAFAYARQFLSMWKADVAPSRTVAGDSIEQKSTFEQSALDRRRGSTGSTLLRLLYAAQVPRCRSRNGSGGADRQPDGHQRQVSGSTASAARARDHDRKGEHAEIFEELRGQGFVRGASMARSSSSTIRRSRCAAQHTNRAVVDRIKVRPDAASAWRNPSNGPALGDGVARARCSNRPKREELVFSKNSRARSAVRLFELERGCSPSQSAGACPTCDGLGVKQFFDPKRVVNHPHLEPRRRSDPRLGRACLLTFR